jgi:hypothetical protein
MSDGFNTSDSLMKCAILANILNNDELKPITTLCEFILEEGALDYERTVPRTECPASRYFFITQVAR